MMASVDYISKQQRDRMMYMGKPFRMEIVHIASFQCQRIEIRKTEEEAEPGNEG
ncbi:MAG: hypothetical protein U0Z17_10375 [Bacteroidales bacterium]